jgi:26S proteasome regulatory subunit T2
LLEEEFVQNQERLKPLGEDKNLEERSKVDDLRGSPMQVGTLEEIIDDDHAIVSSATGSDQYVSILSMYAGLPISLLFFVSLQADAALSPSRHTCSVDKDLLEPGCSVLLHHKSSAIIGVLQDDADPMVNV